MPNGKEYNHDWCDERHEKIGQTFDVCFRRIDRVEAKLWAVLILLFANLGGIGVLLFQGGPK